MKSTKLICLILVFMFIAVGCKKKEPEPPQQAGVEVETVEQQAQQPEPARPTEPTQSPQQAPADTGEKPAKLAIPPKTAILPSIFSCLVAHDSPFGPEYIIL